MHNESSNIYSNTLSAVQLIKYRSTFVGAFVVWLVCMGRPVNTLWAFFKLNIIETYQLLAIIFISVHLLCISFTLLRAVLQSTIDTK